MCVFQGERGLPGHTGAPGRRGFIGGMGLPGFQGYKGVKGQLVSADRNTHTHTRKRFLLNIDRHLSRHDLNVFPEMSHKNPKIHSVLSVFMPLNELFLFSGCVRVTQVNRVSKGFWECWDPRYSSLHFHPFHASLAIITLIFKVTHL